MGRVAEIELKGAFTVLVVMAAVALDLEDGIFLVSLG